MRLPYEFIHATKTWILFAQPLKELTMQIAFFEVIVDLNVDWKMFA